MSITQKFHGTDFVVMDFENSISTNSSVNAVNIANLGTPLALQAAADNKRRPSDTTTAGVLTEHYNRHHAQSRPHGQVRLILTHQHLTDMNVGLKMERCITHIRRHPSVIGRATMPLEINLNHNAIGSKGLERLADIVSEASQIGSPTLPLCYFECISNNIGDDGAATVAKILNLPSLQRLKVGDNQLTVVGARIIADALLRSHPEFIQLHIGGNPIGDEGVRRICDASATSKIEVLGLRDISFTEEGWEAVGRMIATKGGCIKELQLKGNKLTASHADAFARGCLAEGEPSFKLISLGINNCEISAEGAGKLFSVLRGVSTLSSLDASHNPLGDEGVATIIEWLAIRKSIAITKLSLDRVGMTSASLRLLASQPHVLQTISHLSLSSNKLTSPDDISSLVTIIQSSPLLESLDLSHCHLRGSFDVLIDALATRPHLRSLYFASNFGSKGPWGTLMTRCPRLQRLTLTDNGLSSSDIHQLIDRMHSSTTMTFVQLGGQSKLPPLANELLREAVVRANTILDRNCKMQRPTDTHEGCLVVLGDEVDQASKMLGFTRPVPSGPPPSYASARPGIPLQPIASHIPTYGLQQQHQWQPTAALQVQQPSLAHLINQPYAAMIPQMPFYVQQQPVQPQQSPLGQFSYVPIRGGIAGQVGGYAGMPMQQYQQVQVQAPQLIQFQQQLYQQQMIYQQPLQQPNYAPQQLQQTVSLMPINGMASGW